MIVGSHSRVAEFGLRPQVGCQPKPLVMAHQRKRFTNNYFDFRFKRNMESHVTCSLSTCCFQKPDSMYQNTRWRFDQPRLYHKTNVNSEYSYLLWHNAGNAYMEVRSLWIRAYSVTTILLCGEQCEDLKQNIIVAMVEWCAAGNFLFVVLLKPLSVFRTR